ncbi:MAG: urease subunit beta [Nitrospirales bacterium]|nr:urease subunit beta [Nitrospirales bacterium]
MPNTSKKRKVKLQTKAPSKKAPTKSRRKTASSTKLKKGSQEQHDIIPGQLFLGKGDIVAFEGRRTIEVTVGNTGDRPIQVGSHCHFFESNRALRFDREKAFGFRLSIPAGTAVRFEPGENKDVTLVAIGGNRIAYGINGLTEGSLDDAAVKARALDRATEQGFLQND